MVTRLRAILYNFLTGMHDEPLQHVSSKNDQIVDYAFSLNNISDREGGRSSVCVLGVFSDWEGGRSSICVLGVFSGWEDGWSSICVLGVFSGWEGGRSSVCVLGVLILYLSGIFQFDFVTVPTVWYFLFF
jgi:hypothetical protein